MRIIRNHCALLLAFGCSFSIALRAHGAITGQWDFKSGNLQATIGQDLHYLDSDTQSGTHFGSTASFGIPNIAGVVTNVMSFPKAMTENGGYLGPVGASANAGGSLVNQYTVIM